MVLSHVYLAPPLDEGLTDAGDHFIYLCVTWENHSGVQVDFKTHLGMKTWTL